MHLPYCFIYSSEQLWQLNGKLHRIEGPAITINNDDAKHWYLNGKRHRENGPAITLKSGTKIWYLNDELHRIEGPAIERYNGNNAWYYKGKFMECSSQEEFERLLRLKAFW